jgi:hypothetical protein
VRRRQRRIDSQGRSLAAQRALFVDESDTLSVSRVIDLLNRD